MQFVEGGVTAPLGFTANGILCGIKAGRTKNDTALIFSEKICNVAGVFTQNRVQAESVKLTKKNIANGKAQAAIVNCGYANACTGETGAKIALREAKAAADELKISPDDMIVCSTGIIGQQLPVEVIEKNIGRLAAGLSKKGHEEARVAIMTTDTHYKECSVETEIGGKKVTLGNMSKGSGMIHINLGTMLGFITTDCAITSAMLQKALQSSVQGTYNCVSIDGDTSTNDTLVALANGMAGNKLIESEGADYDAFLEALNMLNTEMAKKIGGDGEGADKLLECCVTGAKDVQTARLLAKSVISSSLVKAAFFGRDANWGRILCAMGYSGADFEPENVSVSFTSVKGAKRHGATDVKGVQQGVKETIQVSDHGNPVDFDEAKATEILSADEVTIEVKCEDGTASGTAWGCDLTYDYVKINGDYRS